MLPLTGIDQEECKVAIKEASSPQAADPCTLHASDPSVDTLRSACPALWPCLAVRASETQGPKGFRVSFWVGDLWLGMFWRGMNTRLSAGAFLVCQFFNRKPRLPKRLFPPMHDSLHSPSPNQAPGMQSCCESASSSRHHAQLRFRHWCNCQNLRDH